METKRLFLNEHEVSRLDTSYKKEHFRITTRETDIKINGLTRDLIEFVSSNQGRRTSFLIRVFSERENVSAARTEKAIKRLFEKNIFREEPGDRASDNSLKKEGLSYRKEMSRLWFRVKIIDADKYSELLKKMGFTFSRPFVVVSLGIFLTLEIYFFYFSIAAGSGNDLMYYSPYDYLVFLPLGTFLTMIHETGHAVAVKTHDLPMPKGLGVGMYYFFIIYYADTHESWNLPRRERAMVSVAGVYWEALALILLIPVCIFLGSAALRDFILLTHLSTLYVFNPFLKMDGYWFLSDLLGVINLHDKVFAYFKELLGKTEEAPRQPGNPFFGYPKRVKRSIIAYGLLYFPFMGVFIGLFLYRACLILLDFRTRLIGRLLEIMQLNFTEAANRIQAINGLVRNLGILTGAIMLFCTATYRLFIKK